MTQFINQLTNFLLQLCAPTLVSTKTQLVFELKIQNKSLKQFQDTVSFRLSASCETILFQHDYLNQQVSERLAIYLLPLEGD